MATTKIYLIELPQKCVFGKKKIFGSKYISEFALNYVTSLASFALGIPKELIIIEREIHGKPYISGHKEWQFNISHTEGMIAVAVSDEPIGVDVEKIKKADMQIAKRFFTERENEYIENTEDGQDIKFFEIWTKKEAYIKYTGKGFSESLNSFDVFTCSQNYKTYYLKNHIVSVYQQALANVSVMMERCTDSLY